MTEYESYAVWSVVASSVIFAAVIVWVFRKYLAPGVAAAQRSRNDEIAASIRRRDEAVAELERLRAEHGAGVAQLEAMRERARDDARRERERILTEARTDGEHAVRNAEGELERARRAGQERVRAALLRRALDHAKERATRELDARRDATIVDAFAASLSPRGASPYALAGDADHGR